MWKRVVGLAGLVVSLVLVFSLPVFAQNNWGQRLTGETESFTGTVTAVDLTPPEINLSLKIDDTIFLVELGPAWLVDDFSVNVGETITVVGERVDGNTLVAYQVSKSQDGNTVTLTLRDANGRPVWSGTSGPKPGNRHRNRNQVTLQDGGSGNNGGNTPGQGYQSGPQDGSGNQWGRKDNERGGGRPRR